MSATKKQKVKVGDKETVFPDRPTFEMFLEYVERHAEELDVKPKNIPLIIKVLEEKFGQGLPEKMQW